MIEDDFYYLGTDQGILRQLYGTAEFTVCPKELIKPEDPLVHEIAVRSAATYQSNRKQPRIRHVYVWGDMADYEVILCEKEIKVQFKIF
ncbi:integrase core domain protein [Plakobranchus ocellatus]|uniref:Integrase core domain protein n=1 Tax=Plakobranchus ocellatus TaxID=259542 RepID=A0AAV4BD01_9GAST|nr:integrase core domain protein [Plakobranchus ocellatus]